MEKISVTLTNAVGLHARPASLLTKLANNFECNIEFYKNENPGKKGKLKSILSVLALGAAQGDILTFEANGRDEKEAVKAIDAFIKGGCGE